MIRACPAHPHLPVSYRKPLCCFSRAIPGLPVRSALKVLLALPVVPPDRKVHRVRKATREIRVTLALTVVPVRKARRAIAVRQVPKATQDRQGRRARLGRVRMGKEPHSLSPQAQCWGLPISTPVMHQPQSLSRYLMLRSHLAGNSKSRAAKLGTLQWTPHYPVGYSPTSSQTVLSSPRVTASLSSRTA